jgi:hypothetical protein
MVSFCEEGLPTLLQYKYHRISGYSIVLLILSSKLGICHV